MNEEVQRSCLGWDANGSKASIVEAACCPLRTLKQMWTGTTKSAKARARVSTARQPDSLKGARRVKAVMGRHLHPRAPAARPPPPPKHIVPARSDESPASVRILSAPTLARAPPGSCACSPVLTSARPSSSRAVIMATMVKMPADALKNIKDTNAPSPGKVEEPKKRAAPDEVLEGEEKKASPEKKAKEAAEVDEEQKTEVPASTDTDMKDADINEAKEGVEAEAEPKEPFVEVPAKDADVNEVKEGVEAEPQEPVVEAPAKASCVVE